MSARLKMHALRHLSWCPDSENKWTLCNRHVKDRQQIAAFEDGVTCKQCLASLKFSADHEAEWKARREVKP